MATQYPPSASSDDNDDDRTIAYSTERDRKRKRPHKDQGHDNDNEHELDGDEDQDQDQDQDYDSSRPPKDGSQSPDSKIPKHMARKPNPASPALRKEQNRAAQRAFRDRKERHLQQLENMIRDLKEQQFRITTRFQREVQQLKTRLDSTKTENLYLREVVFAFETALTKDGYVEVLQTVKQELFRRHNGDQGQAQRLSDKMPTGPSLQSTSLPRSSWQQAEQSTLEPPTPSLSSPHPLAMSLSMADPSQEMEMCTANREILYKAPPLFISVASENGTVTAIASPLKSLNVLHPSYIDPGTVLPKVTEYTKHLTVFDELQSSLFPPGTLQSVVRSSMATPQEVVNDDVTLFDQLQESEERKDGRMSAKAVASKIGLLKDHRLQREFNVLVSVPPAVDPNISPQIYEIPHDSRIDLVPCPKLRAQMILHQGKYDLEDLFQVLVNKSICHGHPLDVSSWELPDEFFDRYGFLMGLDLERIRSKVWPKKDA
ncbi:hypothetical protein BGZ58_007747 [Dissophora ornata]|nr:hypothetical protein BGZ58_007747 [Dissophora ornata]